MKKLIPIIAVIMLCALSCEKSEMPDPQVKNVSKSADVTKLLINKSTIYRVGENALWTTTLNQLQVITKFNITSTTRIYLNNKPAQLGELKRGYRVTIYYYEDTLCASALPCLTAVIIYAYS